MIIVIDSDTIVTDQSSMALQQEIPMHRSEQNVARPVKYLHTQAEKKQVEFMQDAIQWSAEQCHTILTDDAMKTKEYDPDIAPVLARIVTDINKRATAQGASFAQQYMVQKEIKKYGEAKSKAAIKELDQLLKRNCFMQINVPTLTATEKSKAVNLLLFLTKKRSG